MQEKHDLPNGFLLRPRLLDLVAAFRANPIHFLESRRLALDDIKDLLAEPLDQFLRIDWSYPANHAAAEVFFDALAGGRRAGLEHGGLELQAEVPVLPILAFGCQPLARVYFGKTAHHRHRLTLAAHADFHDGKPGLLVEKRDPLNQSREAFGSGCGSGRVVCAHAKANRQ